MNVTGKRRVCQKSTCRVRCAHRRAFVTKNGVMCNLNRCGAHSAPYKSICETLWEDREKQKTKASSQNKNKDFLLTTEV